MSTLTINDELYQRATEAAAAQGKTVEAFSGNRTSANGELFDALVPKIIAYRQVSDATLLHLARVCDLKLTTDDRPVAAVRPWDDNLALLTP